MLRLVLALASVLLCRAAEDAGGAGPQQPQQSQIVASSTAATVQPQQKVQPPLLNKISSGSSGSAGKWSKKIKHILPQATPPRTSRKNWSAVLHLHQSCCSRAQDTPPATEIPHSSLWVSGGECDAPIKRSAASLPEGFIASVFESHTGKQHVDYLPAAANLNVPREAGVVRPNNISEVWEKAGYDPWSAGKDPYATVFVPSLNFEEEDVADVPDDEMADKAGLTKFQLEQKQANKEAEDLKYVFSKARHGQYSAIEENLMNLSGLLILM